MQDSEQENLNASLPLHDNDSGKSSEQLAEEIEGELVENPIVLERLLERPQFRAIVSQTCFRGPLPPPSMLREYNDIVAGAAERIMVRSEKEQAHRHEMQNKTVTGTINKDKRGQWMAYSITLLILLIATIFAWRGNTVFAGTLITVDLIGLASVFIMGRVSGPTRQAPTPNNNEEE
ncbi:DUF2335 domain-containing protein [Salmonella enterica]|nr:DUF2335 domain-containing protein [Salmonella enterica subsp. enterica serovar Sandiego]EEK2382818.1 DUF2335 domain-containing protein [Salmonella enterica subsp. enterica serovar Typhimurium]EEP9290015.1 DUF2335 domain-containing protein [Salmonella enterica]EGX8325127.1 DUF2335 domain-containing protein [Salmonella enterica subsp. enterica serovar Javiana]HCM1957551.1 DUF2335 domain-containing protein [Salmonella enterica subsp. houtenae serovar Houten]